MKSWLGQRSSFRKRVAAVGVIVICCVASVVGIEVLQSGHSRSAGARRISRQAARYRNALSGHHAAARSLVPRPFTTVTIPQIPASLVDAISVPPDSSVAFTSASDGWMSRHRTLYATTDSGRTWSKRLSNPSVGTLDFVNSKDGWLLSSSSVLGPAGIMRTTDSGRTWLSLPEPSGGAPYVIDKVDFVSGTLGWAVTAADYVLETTDAGVHWVRISVPARSNDLCFSSTTVGWLMTTRGVYRTSDAGVSWTLSYPIPADASLRGGTGPIAQVACSSRAAWALIPLVRAGMGEDGFVLVATGDAGRSWTKLIVAGALREPAVGSLPATMTHFGLPTYMPDLAVATATTCTVVLEGKALTRANGLTSVGGDATAVVTLGTSLVGASMPTGYAPYVIAPGAGSSGTDIWPQAIAYSPQGTGWLLVSGTGGARAAQRVYQTTNSGVSWTLSNRASAP
ncbi:MAG: YCF48-related protein [Actinomycetota bacterium]|nr:YCF48-related protein [Actinomycetota bacterium]